MKPLALVLTVLAGAAVAAADVKFATTYRAPGVPAISFSGQKVAAVFFSKDDGNSARVSVEETLARLLTERGVTGVASYRLVPKEELTNTDVARGFFQRADVKGVVALRVLGIEERKTWQPSLWVGSYYSTWWDYWGYGWGPGVGSGYNYSIGVGEGRTTTERDFSVEALVFHVESGKLIWAGMSETTNPKDAQRFINDLLTAMVKAMEERGLVKK